jgi:hypothetical protein
MPGVSAEQVAAAREVDLLTYLRANEPHELVHSSRNEYRTKTHGSLVLSNGKWYWHRGGFGGVSSLDYLIKVRGMGFVAAVEAVCGICPSPALSCPSAKQEKHVTEKKALILPRPAKFPSNALAYLQGRGIDPDTVRRCMDAGIIYESRYGDEPVCVFVGKDDSGAARFGCIRGTRSDLKMDCRGSDKRIGFKLAPDSSTSGALSVFESPIDAISHRCLFPGYGGHRLSLGGVSDTALIAFLNGNLQVMEVSLCLDADKAGQDAARRIACRLSGDVSYAHIHVSITTPSSGKDFNEELIRSKGAGREHRGASLRKGASLPL